MHQIRFRLGLRPRLCWGSLQRSPRPPSWIQGGLLLREERGIIGGRDGTKEERKGEREGREKRREREGGTCSKVLGGIDAPGWLPPTQEPHPLLAFQASPVPTPNFFGNVKKHAQRNASADALYVCSIVMPGKAIWRL